MESKWYVYCHTTPSGKKYIGITRNKPETRWKNGKGYSSNHIFTAAINKYGWENISHEILLVCDSPDKAKEAEKYFIAHFKTKDRKHGYNFTDGGDGTSGYEFSKEAIEKLREAQRNRTYTEERNQKISEKLKGIPKTEEQKIKQRIAMTGRKASEKTRQLFSEKRRGKLNPRYGQHCSEETKLKISAANKGKIISEEHKKKISDFFSKPIYCDELDKCFRSIKDFANEIGCDPSTVSQALNGHRGKPPTNTVKGYHISFKNGE